MTGDHLAAHMPGLVNGMERNMPDELSHEEIANRFLESKALNFEAIGRFVADLGPELVVRDRGLHGVLFGKYSTIACALTADDLDRLLGTGGIRGLGRMAEALDLPSQKQM
jgi:hypothetical protein